MSAGFSRNQRKIPAVQAPRYSAVWSRDRFSCSRPDNDALDGGRRGLRLYKRENQREQERHRRPAFRALSTSSAMRSNSSCETREPSPPSSAATTLCVEPSKKV